jgi:hypothetical protein
MNEKLLLIKEQLENLTKSINEYLESTENEVIVIKKEEFKKIKFLGVKEGRNMFDFNNGVNFQLLLSNPYEEEHYAKLLSGKLDRMILRKRETPYRWYNWTSNYELESEVETKLRDLYKSQP